MIYKNLIHKLEYTVRELLGAEMTPEDIHSLVNMILNDWIIDGEMTEEYKQLAVKAIELREQVAADENRAGIIDLSGNKL